MDLHSKLSGGDALKAIELLELYRSKLSHEIDHNLIEAIDKVIAVFNNQFFIAIFEIQRFYTDILSNKHLSASEKTKETLFFLDNLKINLQPSYFIVNNDDIDYQLSPPTEYAIAAYGSLEQSGPLPIESKRTQISQTLPDNNPSYIKNNNVVVHDFVKNVFDDDVLDGSDDGTIVFETVIMRDERGFGFSVAGGIDNSYLHPKDPGIYITRISPGGPVDINGSLRINDQILSVNGTDMTYLSHETAVGTLKQAGSCLHLVIRRNPQIKTRISPLEYTKKNNKSSPINSKKINVKDKDSHKKFVSQVLPQKHISLHKSSPPTQSKTTSLPTGLNQTFKTSNKSITPRTLTVTLIKTDRGLGFSIGGGRGNEQFFGDPGIYITKITENGVAAKSGVIEEGDKLLQVNDYIFTGLTHDDAVNVLYNVGPTVKLKLLKCPTNNEPQSYYIESDPKNIEFVDPNICETDSNFEELHSDIVDKSPRVVVIDRPNETISLGFNIVGGEDEDGIFVSFINPNGIADLTENIFIGDRIWQVNGTDISVATHDEAVALLKGAGKKVELLLTTDMNEYTTFESKFCSWSAINPVDRQSIRSASKSTPNLAETPGDMNYEENDISNTFGHRNKIDKLTRSIGRDLDYEIQPEDAQESDIFRASGMYKSCKSINVFPDANSVKNDKDSLIENDKENRLIVGTRSITSSLSTDRNSYLRKNGLYVRALFDYDPNIEKVVPSRPLSFLANDILYIVNFSDLDWWQARLIEDSSNNGPFGIIPSPQRLHRKGRRQKRKVNFDKENDRSGQTLKNNKASFLKRLQTSGMNKSMQDIDGSTSDYFDEKFEENNVMEIYYEPLLKINLDYIRPVVIVGPMRERINDMLISEHPELFASCVPHTTRPIRPNEIDGKDYHFLLNREEMENDIRHQKFVEAGQYKGNLYGTSVEAVRTVAQRKHCILDVSALAIKRLISSNLLPITVLIRPPSVKSLCNLNSKFTIAQADNQVKKTEELQKKMGHLFTAVIWSEDFNKLYSHIKSIIQSNSGSEIWIPINQNGGT